MIQKSTPLSNDIDKILDFIQEYLEYPDRELLEKYVREHYEYGTFDYAINTEGDIVCAVRYNLHNDNTIADVLDFAIRKDMRNKGVGKDFILRALGRFPNIRNIRFQRSIRGDERFRVVNIKRILVSNIF